MMSLSSFQLEGRYSCRSKGNYKELSKLGKMLLPNQFKTSVVFPVNIIMQNYITARVIKVNCYFIMTTKTAFLKLNCFAIHRNARTYLYRITSLNF